MGNLEKAGVLVVVALLAVILVVAFLNFPEQSKPPVLGASAKNSQAEMKKAAQKPEPQNVYPPEPEIIRPKVDLDRSSSEAPPRPSDAPVTIVPSSGSGPIPKRDDTVMTPNPPPPQPISIPRIDPTPPEEKKSHSPWPKTVKVQSGDSLWAIAVREYGAKMGPRMLGAITDANPKARPEALKAGTELSLPAPPTEAGVASKAGGDEPKAPAKTPSKSSSKEPAASKPSRKLPFVPE